MKQLISLLLIIVVAVAVTLGAQGNSSKVLIFFDEYRIDMSLNFAVAALLLLFFVFYVLMRVWRASSQLPGKFKEYRLNKKQNALLRANTSGVIAYITGDDHGSQKALVQATKTGIETDLSYLIRAVSAIQSAHYDVAEQILDKEKAQSGEHSNALLILRGRVALAKNDPAKALSLLDSMDPLAAKLPAAQRLKLHALIGLGRWAEALDQHRLCVASKVLEEQERSDALQLVYRGLCEEASGNKERMQVVLSNAKPLELSDAGVLKTLASGLMRAGLVTASRKMLEAALKQQFNKELLPTYHQVAVLESRDALSVVEQLLIDQPDDLRLIELAADVCEREQLWGKAISRFEAVYSKQPSAHLAGKLERLYESASQPERAKVWRDRKNNHLQNERQLA
jgi:HemY protein